MAKTPKTPNTTNTNSKNEAQELLALLAQAKEVKHSRGLELKANEAKAVKSGKLYLNAYDFKKNDFVAIIELNGKLYIDKNTNGANDSNIYKVSTERLAVSLNERARKALALEDGSSIMELKPVAKGSSIMELIAKA